MKRDYRTLLLVTTWLMIAGCLCTPGGLPKLNTPTPSAVAVIPSTRTASPAPTETDTLAADTATPEPSESPSLTPSPEVSKGDFADFHSIAKEIDQALKDKDTSLFKKYAPTDGWTCMGDETAYVCGGQPAGVLNGIAVTKEWKTYKVYSISDYQKIWQSAFKQGIEPRLIAISNQPGDNPLMPGASMAYQAVISWSKAGGNPALAPVHVLYFEYYLDSSWVMWGELDTTQNSADWLGGKCETCYGLWEAWKP